MSGFTYRKTFVLVFGDQSLDGLSVSMRASSIDVMLEVRELRAPRKVTHEESAQIYARACELIAEHLLEWNLEDIHEQPVPPTAEGVRSQPRELMAEILGAWQDAVEGIAVPLPAPSASGERSVGEFSVPMESLSPSLVS